MAQQGPTIITPFKVLTNSVTAQMQQKLYQMGQYNSDSSPPQGISPSSTAFAMAITRLYYADSEGKFHSMKLGGILCLVADRRLHTRLLRLFDINTSELLFQCELYIDFHKRYRELNDYFFSFPVEKVNVGVQFANVHDASVFKNLIQKYTFKTVLMQSENLIQDNEDGDPIPLEEVVKTHKSKLGNSSYDISKPLSFERKEHAGWDPISQTFILNEVPKEIKVLLKKAGFKKKDLKKKETALAIYEILLREIDFENGGQKLQGGSGANSGGRTSGNLQQVGRQSSNDDSRVMNERTGSIMNYGFNQISSNNNIQMTHGDFLDPNKGKQLQNNLRNSSNVKDNKYQTSSPDIKQDDKPPAFKAPPLPPPMMGMIPPPPMGMIPPPPMGIPSSQGFPPPPNIQGIKITPPNLMTQSSAAGGGVNALSFNEQLMLQSQNLKKVQENQINTKVKNLSESQQMKIAINLAVVLEQRRKALMNDKKGESSDVESDDHANDSEGSAW